MTKQHDAKQSIIQRQLQEHMEKLSLIQRLEEHKDRPVRVVVNYQQQQHYGNLDDGEDSSFSDKEASFDHVLKNAYLTRGADEHESNLAFLRSSNGEGDVLVPFTYNITQHINIRQSASYDHNTVEALIFDEDEGPVRVPWFLRHFLDDGVKSYSRDYMKEREREENETYSLLGKKGCSYSPQTHTISGDIDALVEKLVPLWQDNDPRT